MPRIEQSMAAKNIQPECSSLLSYLAGMQDRYILSTKAFCDQNLWRLAESGYHHLYGIGPRPSIYDMPHYTKIKYLVGDPADTHFPEGFFDYVYLTHPSGEPTEAHLREAARILDDHGTLIITGIDLPVGSSEPFAQARKIGFTVAHQQVARSGLCSLQALKRTGLRSRRRLDSVNLVCPTLGKQEGLAEYALHLKARFEQVGVRANLFRTWKNLHNRHPTIIEYEPRLEQELPGAGLIIETHRLPSRQSIFVEVRNSIRRVLTKPGELFQILQQVILDTNHLIGVVVGIGSRRETGVLEKNLLLARSNDLARFSGITHYTIMPHIAYTSPESHTPASGHSSGIHLGSFGFASKAKNFDKICEHAARLGVPLTLMLSINALNERTEGESRKLGEELRSRYSTKQIRILVGFFSDDEIRTQLSQCSHLISAQDDSLGTSGSLRYMISLGKPVISIDNKQAREAQVYRVKSLDMVTVEYLCGTAEAINLDDGFRYLLKFLESLPEDERLNRNPVTENHQEEHLT